MSMTSASADSRSAFRAPPLSSPLSPAPASAMNVEYTVLVENDGESELITESNAVMVYALNFEKYQNLIEHLNAMKMPNIWASEKVEEGQLWDELTPVISNYFDIEEDDVDGSMKNSLLHITRHIAQNGVAPQFIP